jgi:anti-sigma B factor antagonist
VNQPSLGSLGVDVTTHSSGVTVAVSGDMDLSTSPVLLERLAAVALGEVGGELTIDLANVPFCDSAGITALIGLRQRCEQSGWLLRVANPQPAVRRMLVDFTGLGDYLNVV